MPETRAAANAAPWAREPVPEREPYRGKPDQLGRMVYPIKPVAKPRPRVTANGTYVPKEYKTFKRTVKAYGVLLPAEGYHVIFVLPMPRSWSKTKKAAMYGTKHESKPDRDNLEKALLDACMAEDSAAWDGRTSKIWGYEGLIVIETGLDTSITLPDCMTPLAAKEQA